MVQNHIYIHMTVGNEAKVIRRVHAAGDKTSKQEVEEVWMWPYSGKKKRREKEVVNLSLYSNIALLLR